MHRKYLPFNLVMFTILSEDLRILHGILTLLEIWVSKDLFVMFGSRPHIAPPLQASFFLGKYNPWDSDIILYLKFSSTQNYVCYCYRGF
jgi:hypothetical protein